MAMSNTGVAEAEITLCVQRDNFGDRRGGARRGPECRLLPWAFVRFGGDGEEPYVMPVDGFKIAETSNATTASSEDVIGNRAWQRVYMEFMPFSAFPLESARPASTNGTGDDVIPGPVAVQFFGGV